MSVDREFFLSFTGADRPWAEWLLSELDAAGYSSVSQLRDFVAGSNFAVEMDQAARRARRTLGVLSAQALQAQYLRQEWAQRLAADPIGERRTLVLVRVEQCKPEGLLSPVVYIDLVGLDEADARARLREELAAVMRGERLLPADLEFPGGSPAAVADVGWPRFPTALPPVWNVPFPRNPTFTGREQTLAEMAEQLGQATTVAVTQALQGGGGVGKTALVVEYAYRHRSDFDTVWWVRAEQLATLVSDYVDLAATLGLDEAGLADQQQVAVAVRHWLENHDRWLLVFDNAEGPEAATGLRAPLSRLADLLPRVLHGQVLVTSRDASWGQQQAALTELDVLKPTEAVRFLLARSGSDDERAAAEIAKLLGGLPLALEQAGAYVREARISLSTYRERLRQFPALTLAKGRPRDRDPTDIVTTTWRVSLDRVRPVPGAVAVLEVCAFLAPEDIPRELFGQVLDPPAPELAVLASDPFALDEAVASLYRYGLLKAREDTLTVHRLLQQVVRDSLDPATAASRAGLAVRLLAAAFPWKGLRDLASWSVYAQLLPHVAIAADHARQRQVEPAATSKLLDAVRRYRASVKVTSADLAAARRREPAAVTRIFNGYAPALFRFFMAAVSDRHLAEDLTGTAFISAIEALPRFRGPVEALGGWLFQIARHDLYDYRRKQARSRIEPLKENLNEAAAADDAPDP